MRRSSEMDGSFIHVFDASAHTAEANLDAVLQRRVHADVTGARIGRWCGVVRGARDRKTHSAHCFDHCQWQGLGVTNVNQILVDSVRDQVNLFQAWGLHARG